MELNANWIGKETTLTAARIPIVLWVLLVTTATITLQTIVNPVIVPTIYFLVMIAVHVSLYWHVKVVVSVSRLLYVTVQGVLIFSTALLMPDGMPALLIGLLPVLIGQCLAIYRRLIIVSMIFGILYACFCIFTLNTQWSNDILLFIALMIFMTIIIISYAILFYRQVESRMRTEFFLKDLKQAHDQVEQLTIANERQRMARDLHDTLAQGLAGLIMQLEATEAHLNRGNLERAKEIVNKSMSQARRTLADARNAIDDLRARTLPELDWQDAVKSEIHRFSSATGTPVKLNNAVKMRLSGKTMEHLLYVLREALTNIAKHAEATDVIVQMEDTTDGNFRMTIRDNGIGFNPDIIGNQAGHYGLIGIKERVRLIGGHVNILNTGTGTCIQILLQKKESEGG